MTEFPLWAVTRGGPDYARRFFRSPKPARRTDKCVFVEDRYTMRYRLVDHQVWLFDNKKDADNFVSAGNFFGEQQAYVAIAAFADQQSKRSRDLLNAFIANGPPAAKPAP